MLRGRCLPSRVATRLTIIFQERRSSAHVSPHVSRHLGRHKPALDTAVLLIVKRTCREPSWCQDAKPFLRTPHPASTTWRALFLDLLPPFVRPVVRWSPGCTRTSETSADRHSRLCRWQQLVSESRGPNTGGIVSLDTDPLLPRAAQLAPSASPTPSALISSLFDHLVARPPLSA